MSRLRRLLLRAIGRQPATASRAARYALAVALTAGAELLARLAGLPVDAGTFPLLLAAVMVSAWYGGAGPGVLATLLGALTGPLALLLFSATPGWPDVTGLGAFLIEASVICALSTVFRSAQRRAEALAASEQAARTEVEATARRLHAVQSVADIALAHLHLDDLLRELIGRIHDTLTVDTVNILLLTEDGAELEVRASRGLEEEVRQGIRIPLGRGIAGRIATQRGPQLFEDLPSFDISSPVLRAKGLQSLLGVPLLVEGRVIGVLHVGSLRPHRFTGDETQFLRLVADRIAIAIDHARLYEAERRARSEAETAERRFRLLVDGVGDYALYMLDREGRVASWNAGAERMKGYPADEILGRHFSLFYLPEDSRQGVPQQALAGAASEGRYEDERWRVRKDGSRFWANLVITALRDREGGLIGFATVTRDLTERRRAAEIRTRLLEQAISAQEDEQRRIARELHDETGQSLTSLLVGLRALQDAATVDEARARADELRGLTARILSEVRRLAYGLRPSALDDLGLVAALEHHAADYSRARGIAVDVQARGLDAERLPTAVETTLYRIVQEALNNVAKHAEARSVSVVLQRHGSAVQAIVADDGRGFDVEAALKDGWQHLGLHSMRERAALLNGSVTIESTPGEGTTLYAWIPLGEAGHGEDPSADRR